MRLLSRILAFFLFASYLHAQTWFTVVPANQQSLSVTVGLPAGATYRPYSAACPNSAIAPVTVSAATVVVDYADGQNGRPKDTCPGVPKEFDVLETAAVQTVTVNGKPVTVPAVVVVTPPAVTPVKTWSCAANTAVTFSLMSDGTFQVNGPVACKETL